MEKLLALVLLSLFGAVTSEFILTVNLVNYTNPTGLCAECAVPLSDVASADKLPPPVCCDDLPFTNINCDNTGEGRCDTRFRWTIRPFGASLETRPSMGYFFTDCAMSPSTCPLSEMSTTFGQGPAALLGVTPNPLPVSSKNPWTGRIQFHIEAVDSGLPNIIDSLLINLDNLQLGADLTEEMTFTGFYNVSHMTMSFRVKCSPGFCGPHCTTTPQNNPRVATCQTDGTLTCTDNRLDPSPPVACRDCLYNYDPVSNCTACLPGFCGPDCTTTSQNNPRVAECQANGTLTCYDNFEPTTSCTGCVDNYDLTTNCTSCLFGQNISTRCTTCLPGFTGSNCEPESSLDLALVGGVAGGVGGAFLLIILLMAFTVRKNKTVPEVIEMSRNLGHSKNTVEVTEVTETLTMSYEVMQLRTNTLNEVNTEANHTQHYEPVCIATPPTTIVENDYHIYEGEDLDPTQNEQQPEPDYVVMQSVLKETA